MNNAYGVCTMPSTYDAYVEHWEHFKDTGYKLEWLSDITRDPTFDVGFTYTEDDIRKNFNYYKDPSTYHFWNGYGNRTLIWFYPHLRMLNYYLHDPDKDYYWFFDDDVRIDDWVAFLKGFDDVHDDFLAYFIFKNTNVVDQKDVPMIDNNTFSKTEWFNRYPGHGDSLPKGVKKYFGSFFPIVRFSNTSMKRLLELHEEGIIGYSEGYVPTVLNSQGFKLSSIMQPDNTSRFFDVKNVDIKHKNTTIEWKWI